MSATTSIPLRRAYAKFSRKRLGFKPTHGLSRYNRETEQYERTEGIASVHTLPPGCSIVRVAEDEIVVTDGNYGYTPFKVTELQAMLREVKRLPILREFRVDERA